MKIKMRLQRYGSWLAALPLLVGCGAKAVTFDEAAEAIRRCGMSPDDVLWRVTEKGEVVFGRKRGDAPGPSYEEVDCFMRWATEHKVKVSLVGWEAKPATR